MIILIQQERHLTLTCTITDNAVRCIIHMTYHINCRRAFVSTTHTFIVKHSAIVAILKILHHMCKCAVSIITISLCPSLRAFVTNRPKQVACRILKSFVRSSLSCHCSLFKCCYCILICDQCMRFIIRFAH